MEPPPSGTRAAWVEELTAILVPIVRHRIARLGEDESGAYNYYASRIRDGAIFSDYEIRLADWLLARNLPIDRVHEIGTGIGQLAMLLGWNGIRTVGFERDPRTFRTAALALRALSIIEPELTEAVRLIGAQFPLRPETGFLDCFEVAPDMAAVAGLFPADAESAETAAALVLTTNTVATFSPEDRLAAARAMRRYRFALIDADRFFGEGDRDRVLGFFETAGFTVADTLDLGRNGCYCLFGNPGEDASLPARPAIDLGALGDRILRFFSEWVAASPEHENAAGDYYLQKFARRVVFEPYDLAVAQYAGRQLPGSVRCYELGSGFGELCLLLALKGFRTTGIDSDAKRHAGAIALRAALAAIGIRLDALGFVEGAFPAVFGADRPDRDGAAALVATDVTSDRLMADMEPALAALPGFDHLILDLRKFGTSRNAAMSADLAARLHERGFAEVASVFCSDDADVRHFRRRP